MLENLDTTHTLAALIGLYFLAAGTGLMISRDEIAGMYEDMKTRPVFGYLGGVMVFAIGGAIVAIHNDWNGWLAGFVSLIGWVALAEGVLLLAVRKWFLNLFGGWLLSPRIAGVFGVITAVLGIVLLYVALSF